MREPNGSAHMTIPERNNPALINLLLEKSWRSVVSMTAPTNTPNAAGATNMRGNSSKFIPRTWLAYPGVITAMTKINIWERAKTKSELLTSRLTRKRWNASRASWRNVFLVIFFLLSSTSSLTFINEINTAPTAKSADRKKNMFLCPSKSKSGPAIT